jgi:hypothetical protein
MRPSGLTSTIGRCAIAASFLLGGSGAAHAGIIGEFTNAGFAYPNSHTYNGPAVNVTLRQNNVTVSDGTAGLNQGGAFVWNGTYTPGTYDQAHNVFTANGLAYGLTNLVTYCIEINQNIYPGSNQQSYYVSTDITSGPSGTAVPHMTAAAAGYITDLWATHYNAALSSPLNSGAFQLAIWKLEYDLNPTYASADASAAIQVVNGVITNVRWDAGNLLASGDTAELHLAATYLQGLINDPTAARLEALISDGTNGNFQDQLFLAAPEPASGLAWLLMSSVVGCVSIARRRRSKAAVCKTTI